VRAGYDANIDIVLAPLYGDIPVTDSRVLATAARLRQQWADPSSTVYYPINGADAARGVGPLLGRYPDDTYDGDVTEPVNGGHPWPVSSACLADLYYRVAAHVATSGAVIIDQLSARSSPRSASTRSPRPPTPSPHSSPPGTGCSTPCCSTATTCNSANNSTAPRGMRKASPT
jgi:hypothetical protein